MAVVWSNYCSRQYAITSNTRARPQTKETKSYYERKDPFIAVAASLNQNKMEKYTIAIATRNRLEALKHSIPKMLNQTYKPSQLVVVDSSDNHDIVHQLVVELTKSAKVDITIIKGERGLTKQRNQALLHVKHPVVFFPDDDSIWFSDTAETQMRAYNADSANQFSAVCAAESVDPPRDFIISGNETYEKKNTDRMRSKFGQLLSNIEKRIAPNPFAIIGEQYLIDFILPNGFADQKIKPVSWMTGFRMSFRTAVIKGCGFDETLSEYALCEDIDASFAAWQQGSVVATTDAKVFHFRSPENRSSGFKIGAMQILNRAYVTAKHTEMEHPARRALIRHLRYKTLQYRIRSRDKYSATRYSGAKAALKQVNLIMDSPRNILSENYTRARANLH